MMRRHYSGQALWLLGMVLIAGLAAGGRGVLADDGESDFEGSIDLLYRSVDIDGNEAKYEEDFDGLTSGARLGELTLNWLDSKSTYLDYARARLSGFGGDPYQQASITAGRRDRFKLTMDYSKQRYLYDLFDFYGDEDGHSWNRANQRSRIWITVNAIDDLDLVFGYEDYDRSGTSLIMKDIERDLFLLDTPVDQRLRRYTIGADIRLGTVDVVFRQALRNYENRLDSSTEGDFGVAIEDDFTTLEFYDWRQLDESDAYLTTLAVAAPFGERVHLDVSYYGTLLGKEELDSRVDLDAAGTDYNDPAETPNEFENLGAFSRAALERDTQLVDADLGVLLASPLTLHLQVRSLDQKTEGTLTRDLAREEEMPYFDTRFDYSLQTVTGLLDYRPLEQFTVRAGYRLIDRDLTREGFNDEYRDEDFSSGSDSTWVAGVSGKALDWLRYSADYEDGDIDRAFTRVSPLETKHFRGRLAITPVDELNLTLTWLDFENRHPVADEFSKTTGTTWAAAFWHRPSELWDYFVRYSNQELDGYAEVILDGAGFGSVFDGLTAFATDNDYLTARVNVRPTRAWLIFARYTLARADGLNSAEGPEEGLPSVLSIVQDYSDAELGVTRFLKSKLYFGGSLRLLDYDDANDLLDYDGTIVTVHIGTSF
jgi:hypothetical protein